VAKRPADFGIRVIERPEDKGFTWSYAYASERGLTMQETSQMVTQCWHDLRQIYPDYELWGVLSWEHFFLYLCRHGVESVKNTVVRPSFDEAAWQDRGVQLRSGVITYSFNHTRLVHDLATGKRFSLKPAALRFLELCQAGLTAGQAMQSIARDEQGPLETTAQLCLSVLKTLAAEGSIRWEGDRLADNF
jgi:hypothetical protein